MPGGTGRYAVKIVVVGGTSLIGSKLVTKLAEHGQEVSNSPSFEDSAVMRFFETSTRNLLDAEAAAGVCHHVALSVVGTERLPDSGYFRAKIPTRVMNSHALATPPRNAARTGTTMMYRPARSPKVRTSPAAKNSADVIVLGDTTSSTRAMRCRVGRRPARRSSPNRPTPVRPASTISSTPKR